jgi:putative redox protein
MAVKRNKVEFESNGIKLAGLLESSDSDAVRAYALFAHCFTCSKDIAAASRISRALVALGYTVLRFDFTGLGNSDGDFSNTNFSSNVEDLVAAADFLRSEFQAPQLLIGHSLGGAAVLKAAESIDEVTAIATIGAPFDAQHVSKQLGSDLEKVSIEGEAEVDLAGRKFKIKKQFVDDIRSQNNDHIAKLRRALLILHSPGDATVNIAEAEKLYVEAKHPKSFISLDKADHLMRQREDSEYFAACISAWARRFLPDASVIAQSESKLSKGHVKIDERNKHFARDVQTDNHIWIADEPISVGGHDLGPNPYEHLLAGLGACTSMTLRMYANHKNLALDDIEVQLNHQRSHAEDCEDCQSKSKFVDVIERNITLKGDLTDAQRKRLLEIADRCPVHLTMENNPKIVTNEV